MTLSERFKMSLDPVRLARACGFEPDEWQAQLLRSNARQILLCCTRQAGKSTATALLSVWTAIFRPGLILLVSPSQRQSGELFRKVKELLKTLGETIGEESSLRLELSNGSRMVSLPGDANTIRGYSKPQLVIIDEAAFIPDDLIAAVRPMLATTEQGHLILLSTPNGKRGAFFEAWEKGGEDWQRFKVTAEQCPRISNEFLARERTLNNHPPKFTDNEVIALGLMQGYFRTADLKRVFLLVLANDARAFSAPISYQQWLHRLHALAPQIQALLAATGSQV